MSAKSVKINLAQIEKFSDIASKILNLEEEIQCVREQLETINQMLYDQCEIIEQYEHEFKSRNNELFNALRLEQLELDEAKELAKLIVKSENPATESIAELLSAIYGKLVKAEELEHKNSSIPKMCFKDDIDNRIVANSKQIRAELKELNTRYNELGTKFVSFKACFMKPGV